MDARAQRLRMPSPVQSVARPFDKASATQARLRNALCLRVLFIHVGISARRTQGTECTPIRKTPNASFATACNRLPKTSSMRTILVDYLHQSANLVLLHAAPE